MNEISDPKIKKQPEKVFVTLSTVVFLCLFCFVGAGAFAWWAYRSRFADEAKLERERVALTNQFHRAEMERQRGAEEAKLTLARTHQTEALARVHAATNTLGQLLSESTALAADAGALKTNDTGKLVALHPGLIALSHRFFEADLRDLPARDEVIQKIETVRRVEQQLLSAQGTAYEPDTALLVTVETASQWGTDGLKKTAHVRTLLSTLTQEAKVKFTSSSVTATSPALETAIQQLAQAESANRQNLILQQTSDAKTNAATTVAQAEAARILEEAKNEAAKIREEMEQARAELARQKTARDAENKLKDTQITVAAREKIDEATRIELKKKASDPQIQGKLAPFTTPGYLYTTGKLVVDKQPHSFSLLKSGGALDPTMAGLQKLVYVAYTNNDKVRPRWKFRRSGPEGWRNNPEEMEMVKETQKLLSELGPVLVEMGMLSP